MFLCSPKLKIIAHFTTKSFFLYSAKTEILGHFVKKLFTVFYQGRNSSIRYQKCKAFLFLPNQIFLEKTIFT